VPRLQLGGNIRFGVRPSPNQNLLAEVVYRIQLLVSAAKQEIGEDTWVKSSGNIQLGGELLRGNLLRGNLRTGERLH